MVVGNKCNMIFERLTFLWCKSALKSIKSILAQQHIYVQVHSLARMTLRYLGRTLDLSPGVFGDAVNVMVMQQHCGGNTVCVFQGLLSPNGKVFLYTDISVYTTGVTLLCDPGIVASFSYKMNGVILTSKRIYFMKLRALFGQCYVQS